ncbi:MAG: response regulator [Candidatus Latescibacteria bacterium]|nr:response regulator [Candidatus Latescibacterota bacterium]NIO56277.1 response regulator [Candidatus Latescibacterota bacterium]
MSRQLEILILDDEEIVCTRLKPALEKAGYRVETFTDSREAKGRLEKRRFDIVVTDLKMANVDGMELFRFVKERWPKTEVIIISGFVTVDVTRTALHAGVRDIIPKPFKIEQLKDLINKVADEISRSQDK